MPRKAHTVSSHSEQALVLSQDLLLLAGDGSPLTHQDKWLIVLDADAVYAYVYPDIYAGAMNMFADEPESSGVSMVDVAFHSMLSLGSVQFQVARPHQIEINALQEKLEHAHYVASEPLMAAIDDLITRVDADPRLDVSSDLGSRSERAELLDALAEYGDRLAEVGGSGDEATRLNRFKRLRSRLTALNGTPLGVNDRELEQVRVGVKNRRDTGGRPAWERIASAIQDARGDGKVSATYADALALCDVGALGELAAAKGIHVAFVTVSKIVRRVFPIARDLGIVGSGVKCLHPRSFGIAHLLEEYGEAQGVEEFGRALKVFSSSVHDSTRRWETLKSAEQRARLTRLREAWQAIPRIVDIAHLNSLEPFAEAPQSHQDALRRTVKRLRDIASRDSVQEDVASEMLGVVEAMVSNYTRLTFVAEARFALEALQRDELKGGEVWVRGSREVVQIHWMMFGLYWVDEESRKRISALAQRGTAAWAQLAELLDMDEGHTGKYSRALVRAYVLGALGRWRISDAFAESASLFAQSSAERGEALLVRAHAWYRSDSIHGALDRALELAQEAASLLATDRSRPDGRGKVLMGSIKYKIAWEASRRVGGVAPSGDHLNECVELWESALSLAVDDPRLRAQCYNNLAFAWSLRDEGSEVAREYIERLRSEMNGMRMQRKDWSPVFRDTAVWVEWRTKSHQLSPKQLDGMIAELEEVSGSVGLTSHQQNEIRAHLDELGTVRARIEGRAKSSGQDTGK